MRSSETKATCNDCFARQSICSILKDRKLPLQPLHCDRNLETVSCSMWLAGWSQLCTTEKQNTERPKRFDDFMLGNYNLAILFFGLSPDFNIFLLFIYFVLYELSFYSYRLRQMMGCGCGSGDCVSVWVYVHVLDWVGGVKLSVIVKCVKKYIVYNAFWVLMC